MERNKPDFSLIISTCDKFSDLWEAHVELLNRNWADRNVETFLVTDKSTMVQLPNVTIVAAGESKEITERLRFVMPMVRTKYLLFTLDDYFLTVPIDTNAIEQDIAVMEEHSIDYLRLFVMTMKSLKNRKAVEIKDAKGIYILDNLAGDYIVSLYTGIWRKGFMEETLHETLNAWQYEVTLTKMACEMKACCADSCRGEFPILDVIRKGKILRKAKAYFDVNPIYTGDRPVMKIKDEWVLWIRTLLREWLPHSAFEVAKSVMRKFGYTFFSDMS